MDFSQRVKLADRYHKWLQEENKKHPFKIANNPETFLVFLSMRGLLKEFSAECKLMNAREDCEDYKRQANFTCDMSDICASCMHSKNVEEVMKCLNRK